MEKSGATEGEWKKEDVWCRETVPKVLKLVCSTLPLSQTHLVSLLLVSPSLHRTLLSCQPLWQSLTFRELNNAGNRLLASLSLPRYSSVKHINLEFARDVEDAHLIVIKEKCFNSLQSLESLNLNGCQKISDTGIEAIASCCPKLESFSIYWNVRVADTGLLHIVRNCKRIIDLNISGCKNISDRGVQLVADNYPELESLNLTRCVKVTDEGLKSLLHKCLLLQSLNLYALSSFTDEAYQKIYLLSRLKFLDLCGAQNLSDEGLSCISKCKNLVSLNLTWCVRVTDKGVMTIAEGCTSLEFLSLFGIIGVTDKCLEALSKSCSNKITTLDVNGLTNFKRKVNESSLALIKEHFLMMNILRHPIWDELPFLEVLSHIYSVRAAYDEVGQAGHVADAEHLFRQLSICCKLNLQAREQL
ncbi:hypothetical protein Fmac_020322 [Flemingia macrophylla]|uniref:F-box/LRR-repeat protein 15-like leucin rich repeat domain-containing protein n=1 Tax=Flemingia macrophylla TaxID=520843 RepID=A0ABD1LTP0_9FABA